MDMHVEFLKNAQIDMTTTNFHLVPVTAAQYLKGIRWFNHELL